jgi:hypothetical protein
MQLLGAHPPLFNMYSAECLLIVCLSFAGCFLIVQAFSQSMYHLMAGQLGVKDLTTPEEPGTPAAGSSSSSSKGGKKEEAEEEEEDKDEL